jgi:hypothetical protein
MTDDDYDTLSQKHLASIKRDMRVSLEDATVRATHKVMAELETDCVGWFGYDTGLRLWFEANKGDDGAIPLYKDPPQRQWVGLTDEEIKEIIGPWGDTPIKGYTRKLFDQIEAKLKEKNT